MKLIRPNESVLGDLAHANEPGDVPVGLTAVDTVAKRGMLVSIGTVAADAAAVKPVFHSRGRSKVLKCSVMVSADAAQSDTNYAIISLVNKGTDGTGTEVVATINTKVTGGVALSDFVPQELGSLSEGAYAAKTLVDREGTPKNTLTITAQNEGRAGNLITVTVANGTTNPSTEFNLTVKNNGTVETFEDLSMDPAADNYVGKVDSDYVVVTDLFSASDAPNNRPAVQANTALLLGANGVIVEDGDVLALSADSTAGTGVALADLAISLQVSPIREGLLG